MTDHLPPAARAWLEDIHDHGPRACPPGVLPHLPDLVRLGYVEMDAEAMGGDYQMRKIYRLGPEGRALFRDEAWVAFSDKAGWAMVGLTAGVVIGFALTKAIGG